MNFLYLKIPMAQYPVEQTRDVEDRVDQLLHETGVGSVAGWGDSLGDALANGTRPVAYTRIDIDVADLAPALALLHARLASLGAPSGTEIHCTIQQRHRKDVLVGSNWVLDQIS